MNPQPKKKPVRLKGKAYTRLRWAAFDRAKGLCEFCGRWAPFRQSGVILGEVCHYPKSRGAGAGDTLEEVKWGCLKCHRKEHGPQWNTADDTKLHLPDPKSDTYT